jgi:hypothetical protein
MEDAPIIIAALVGGLFVTVLMGIAALLERAHGGPVLW